MCIDDTNDTFTILIKSDKRSYEDVLMTVAHELVHVKQYMQNDLGMLLDKHKDLDYDKRWWEHEAVAVSRQMVGLYGLHH
jgi:hypothetical protein